MIDIRSFVAITREAVGSRSVMYRTDETNDSEFGALVRVLTHLLGVEYNGPGWAPMCGKVRQYLDASPRDFDNGAELAVATELIAGALLSLANPTHLAVIYLRTHNGGIGRHPMRSGHIGAGTAVTPDDLDWLRACGYVQAEIIGDLVYNGVNA